MTAVTVLHVLAAILFVGPSIVVSAASARTLRAGADQAAASQWLHRSTVVYSGGTLLVFVLGLALVPLADYSYGDPWLSISMTLYVVNLALLFAVVVPTQRKGISLVQSGDAAGDQATRVAALSGVAAVLWVVILVLMYWQPGG